MNLAQRRGVTASDLIRAVITLTPNGHADLADPGEPLPGDWDVRLYPRPLGPARAIRRKPRLRVRLPAGLDDATIRRLGALALALDDQAGHRLMANTEFDRIALLEQGAADLREMMARLAFVPLKGEIQTPRQAAYALGFLVEFGLDRDVVNARFRALAPIYHPDRGLLADPVRMAQLIAARTLLLQSCR